MLQPSVADFGAARQRQICEREKVGEEPQTVIAYLDAVRNWQPLKALDFADVLETFVADVATSHIKKYERLEFVDITETSVAHFWCAAQIQTLQLEEIVGDVV